MLRSVFLVFTILFGMMPAGAEPALEPLTIETASGRHEFQVELAATPEQQRRGLMFRTEMASDRGMLFDFRTEREAYFWMKNTYISLDIIFIRADGRVHRIAAATTPLSEKIVPSRGPVRAVLELNAGTAEKIGLKPGDRVAYRIFAAE